MFCTKCGKKLEENTEFCTNCGTPIKQQKPIETQVPEFVEPTINGSSINQQPAQDNIKPEMENAKVVSPKKSNKKALVIAGAGVIILLLVAGLCYFMYQKHIMKQADKVIVYLDDEEYDEALDLFEKYSGKKKDFDDKVYEDLKKRAELVKKQYLSEEIEYLIALKQIQFIEEYDIEGINKLTQEAFQWVNMISTSRNDYFDGQVCFLEGDYEGAIEKYNLVVDEDKKFYNLSMKGIEEAQQEEALQEEARLEEALKEEALKEEERVNSIREQYLEVAEDYAKDYNYETAIQTIEQGLVEIPGDSELDKQLVLYQQMQEMGIKVTNIATSEYEYTYQEQDMDIMTVTMEFPVLEDDTPAYGAINQVFDSLKEDYIASNDYVAEVALLEAYDEYFIEYSLDMLYSVQYNNNGILCIMMEGYLYTGGAHGEPIREVYTFDLTTGAKLELADLIATDEESFGPYVMAEFQKMYDEAPAEYWSDSLDIVQNNIVNFSEMKYYIMDDSICIFYHPYTLGSFARGFVEILVPYVENEEMFTFLQ